MASRKIYDLSYGFQPKATALTRAWDAEGISYVITCTLRPGIEQAALYAQGRFNLRSVNIYRARAGLPKITAAQNRRIVTNAKPGESYHNSGDAIDALALDGGKIIHDGADSAYTRMGMIAEDLGIEWAGRWKGRLRESCHFQNGDRDA